MPTPPAILERTTRQEAKPSGPILTFENVSMSFEGNTVLENISFQLTRGESKAIFGVAGSGKSTILKLAAGLFKPDEGTIYALGENVTAMSEDDLFELRRKIGIVFQESALFDSLTVRDNVAFRLLEEGKTSDEEIDKRVEEVLSFVELEHTMDKFPAELSGGMRRRVAIARAIISQPELLLYDSPTGGLDPVTSTTIVELIVKQRDVAKTSSLLVTHRLQDGFLMATHRFDRKTNRMQPLPPGSRDDMRTSFLILREGKIIFDGDLQELAASQDDYIREYVS